MVLLQWGLMLLAGLVLLPVVVLWVEVMAAVGLNQSEPSRGGGDVKPTRAILMPAHNEALVIEQTLRQLMPQLCGDDRVVVVADNCTDATAEIAARFEVTVLERQDTARRGKGYALDFGLAYLSQAPPEVVAVVDADCQVDPGTVDVLCDRAHNTQRPTQAVYLFDGATARPDARQLVSLLAIRVKNWVRPLGLHHMGQPCLLTGTGMAFPWDAIQSVPLASGNLVEDMQLGLDLTLAGYPPLLCPDVRVTGKQPQSTQAATTQRTRWEHGHLRTLALVPKLLWTGLRRRQLSVIALALDLAVPPLALLALLWTGTMAVTAVAALLGSIWLPALVSGVSGLLFTTAVLTAWWHFARNIALLQLLSIPLYLLWKVPLYFKFVTNPQIQWIRTDRE
ncbi:MAG: glycosyltransferase [Cyanobacteria bacterium P01_A01_bin.105]